MESGYYIPNGTRFTICLSGSTKGFPWGNKYNGYEYDITSSTYDGELTWYEARVECLSEGGDLASIGSPAEDNFINTIVSDYHISHLLCVYVPLYEGTSKIFTERL